MEEYGILIDMKNKQLHKKVILVLLGVLLGSILIAGIVFCLLIRKGNRQLREPGKYLEQLSEKLPEYHEKTFDGNTYLYRDGLINILCLGIDGRGKKEENNFYGFGPKADCIYLVSLDTKQNTLTFINISRDSWVPIRWFDSVGKEVGFYDFQLGLQYTMGNGLESSCELMEETVSRMLGGIPIHGYCALYWSGVEVLQEEIGGVVVEVPEELHQLDMANFPEVGEVELTPEQAKIYVQGRDITVTGSNEIRMKRQQTYIMALYQNVYRLLKANPMKVLEMKELVEDYLVTDLSKEELLALGFQFGLNVKGSPVHEVLPGVSVDTLTQDAFYIDEKGLDELLIRTFY